jgi:hypothetical protein
MSHSGKDTKMKNFMKGGIVAIVIAGVAYAALAQDMKDVTSVPAEAETFAVATETASQPLATEVQSIGMVGDDIVIRFTEGADLWTLPAASLEAMCWKGRVLELSDIAGLAPITMSVTKGTLTVGSKSTQVSCPLPAGYEDLGWIWVQRAAEHSTEGEFTDAHLRAMIAVMAKAEPVLITPQRVKGYTTGGDHRMVVAALEQHLGQFKAYVLEVDNLMYIVPMTEALAACGGTCTEPRLVVWHLHRHVYVAKKKSPPRTKTSETTRPTPDGGITMICSDDCK